jgi:hypothetical protein
MPIERCKNCGNPKADHSKFDTFCLKLNEWLEEDFESVETPKPAGVGEAAKSEAIEELVA